MFRFVDTHFHLTMIKDRGIDTKELLDRLYSNGFAGGIDIGVSPHDIEERLPLIKEYPSILYSVGMHPSHSGDDLQTLLDQVEDQIHTYHPHAIGEIGLDYHWEYATPKKQAALCIEQIELANTYHLPVIIHNRDADSDILKILKEHYPESGCILHCYAADEEFISSFMKLDVYISFAGNITFKGNRHIMKAAQLVDTHRILVETDSPYLAPVPKRGRTNTPEYIRYIYDFIADLRSSPVEDFAETVCSNFSELFQSSN